MLLMSDEFLDSSVIKELKVLNLIDHLGQAWVNEEEFLRNVTFLDHNVSRQVELNWKVPRKRLHLPMIMLIDEIETLDWVFHLVHLDDIWQCETEFRVYALILDEHGFDHLVIILHNPILDRLRDPQIKHDRVDDVHFFVSFSLFLGNSW